MAALPPPAAQAPAAPAVCQDPRADPKDHIIRVHGCDPTGNLTFVALNLGLWAADLALFWEKVDPASPDALPNVQLLLGMDLVRALRHCYWKLSIGQAIFPAKTAAGVAAFNFLAATAKLWLASRAGPRVAPQTMAKVLPVAAGIFALGCVLETGSELQRRAFKRTAPKGALFTGGLFSLARNINYTGYILWRVGMAAASCSPAAAVFPAMHAVDFGSRAVPMLERYMGASYGDKWAAYVKKTPYRLIPGLW